MQLMQVYNQFFLKSQDVVVNRKILNYSLWLSLVATVYAANLVYDALSNRQNIDLATALFISNILVAAAIKLVLIDAQADQSSRTDTLNRQINPT